MLDQKISLSCGAYEMSTWACLMTVSVSQQVWSLSRRGGQNHPSPAQLSLLSLSTLYSYAVVFPEGLVNPHRPGSEGKKILQAVRELMNIHQITSSKTQSLVEGWRNTMRRILQRMRPPPWTQQRNSETFSSLEDPTATLEAAAFYHSGHSPAHYSPVQTCRLWWD